MNISSIETELLHLQALIARWKEQKYTPAIEREIALDRLRKLYVELLDLNLDEPPHQPSQRESQPIADAQTDNQSPENTVEESAADQPESQIEDESQITDQTSESTDQEPIVEQCDETVETQVEQQLPDEAQRHRFIHDLFCNDETFYIGEMRKIEALPSFDDVLIYIGQKYAWTPDNATAEEFVAWISSRFDY